MRLPFSIQLPGAAAIALMVGTFGPWVTAGDSSFEFTSYNAGLDGIFGEVALLIGVGAIVLLARLIRRARHEDPGGLAALALLAVVVVGVDGARIHDAPTSIGWGLYVSAIGAIGLLLGGLLLLGGEGEPLPPPD
jgi:hypothetical protein